MDWSKELQEGYKYMRVIKNDQKECASCESPITQKDFDDYKMCPWCYSRHILENEGGIVQ